MNFTMHGNELEIMLSGRLNSDTSPQTEEEIFGFLGTHEVAKIALEMSQLEYISSAGIRVVLKLLKQYGTIRVCNPRDSVYEVFCITGMEDFFEFVRGGQEPKNTETASLATRKAHFVQPVFQPRIPLVGINDTTVDATFIPACKRFEAQVNCVPDKLAVVTKETKITYEKLNRSANRVAQSLIYLGIGPDDVVGIMLPRGIEMYIATLGVMKAGAAYTIVNTAYPDSRIKFIFEDASCRYLISTREVVYERLELFIDELQKRPLFMDELLSCANCDNPNVEIQEADLCYCIYTSGSTGNPKGVMIDHGNLSNFLLPVEKNRELMGQLEGTEVVLAMAQMTFDVSVMEQYVPLCFGKTVALATEKEIMNPSRMVEFMTQQKVDLLCATPSYLTSLLSFPKSHDAIAALKVLDIGAEAFPGKLYDAIRAHNPDVRIMNGYGPTEATISCTMKLITSRDHVTIGVPNANVYVFVVNENNQAIPDGELGELLICGKGIARGYMNLPEKTAASFISFCGMRGYKTGDIVRMNEDGELVYHGRNDNQVKLRGLRIELGEIETVLGSMDGIQMCAALTFENRYLCFYYVCEYPLVLQEIQAYARTHLAHYMIPDLWMELPEMPMTINDKIDRKQLPKPKLKQMQVVAPKTDCQKKIIELLASVMPDETIGIETDLLEMGMSSLDMMVFISLLGDAFDISVAISDIYAHPTVEQIEEQVKTAPKLRKREAKNRYPATIVQSSGFFGVVSDGENLNLPMLYTLHPSIQNEKLKEAIYQTMEAHPGLTARFEMNENHLVESIPQNNCRAYPIHVTYMDDADFDKHKASLSVRFGATDQWLFRFEIIETQSRKFLFADYSHLNSDGESISIILDDIISAYEGKTLAPEEYTMFDQEDDHAFFWESSAGRKCIAYYEGLLSTTQGPTTLTYDIDGEATGIRQISREMDAPYHIMEQFCKEKRISINILMGGLLALTCARFSDRKDAAFTFGYSGRNDSRLQRTIGYIATVMLPCFHIDRFDSFTAFLKQSQKQIMNLMMFPCMPIMQLYSKYPSLVDLTFIYQPYDSGHREIAGTTLTTELLQDNTTQAPKTCFQAIGTENGILWTLAYQSQHYSKGKMEQVLAYINNAMNRALQTDDIHAIFSV